MEQPILDSPGVFEMLGDVVGAMRPLARTLQDSVGPIQRQKTKIRSILEDKGMIQKLPGERPYMSLAAVDGAYTLSPLFIGDQINVLALSVRSDLDSGAMDIMGYEAESSFQPHSPGSEMYAKSLMLSAEMRLLGTLADHEDTLGLIDGSHLTGLTTVAGALGEPGTQAFDLMLEQVMSGALISAIRFLSTENSVLACPKSDSSTELADFIEQQTGEPSMRLPDKVMASLVMEPGEILTFPGSRPAWGRYDMTRSHITSKEGLRARALIDEAVAPLREQGLTVAHIKPDNSSTAIRVETKGSLNPFEAMDYWQALADDCAPPHTQEPVAQYMADKLAKDVSVAASVQLDSARLDLAELSDDGALLEFMIRSYRTT